MASPASSSVLAPRPLEAVVVQLSVDALSQAVAERVAERDGAGTTVRLLRLRRKGSQLTALYSVTVDGAASGTVHASYAPGGALNVVPFPQDAGLPALQIVCSDPAAAWPDAGAEVSVDVARYKPGSRCLLRLRAQSHVRYLKLYASADQAEHAWRVAQLLDADAGMRGCIPPNARYLRELQALVTDAAPGTSGTTLLRPARPRAGFALRGADVPEQELRAAGVALARLHAVTPAAAAGLPRDLSTQRASARVRELVALHPATAPHAECAGATLLSRLADRATDAAPRVGHGAYKPSQLLFSGASVTITDFDGADLADPARDIGYFLGYLRPRQLWTRTDGAAQWYDRAAAAFRSGYAQQAQAGGRDSAEVTGTLARTGAYEAVALVKRAVRRAHRVNAIRPAEVEAILDEIDNVLDPDAVPAGGARKYRPGSAR